MTAPPDTERRTPGASLVLGLGALLWLLAALGNGIDRLPAAVFGTSFAVAGVVVGRRARRRARRATVPLPADDRRLITAGLVVSWIAVVVWLLAWAVLVLFAIALSRAHFVF